jgi:tetraacyldisaccharide 4'-kinase
VTVKQPLTFQQKWYNGHPLVWLLSPFALLFFFLSGFRRLLFKVGLKKSYRPNVPVVVVGNISVGGNGKTPVVLALAEYYKKRGVTVGILSRGYGAQSPVYPRIVNVDDNPVEVGDEPRLLAGRSGCTVVIDPVRARGAKYLESHCGCDLIICDDGLQHYALSRDIELVVMDDRRIGSGYLLPMGPLREGGWRLGHVDAVIHNGSSIPDFDQSVAPQFLMSLTAGEFVNVANGEKTTSLASLQSVQCSALAGIGSPQRFFTQLRTMGLQLAETKALPDHHAFSQQDIVSGTVIMTEKDAVKVKAFAHHDCWYLPVTAQISADFYQLIDSKLLNAGLRLNKENKE